MRGSTYFHSCACASQQAISNVTTNKFFIIFPMRKLLQRTGSLDMFMGSLFLVEFSRELKQKQAPHFHIVFIDFIKQAAH